MSHFLIQRTSQSAEYVSLGWYSDVNDVEMGNYGACDTICGRENACCN